MISPNSTPETEAPQPRRTYPQDWPSYNAAQTSEKGRVMELLADLCATVPQPEYRRGRPRLPIADMVFASAAKVYSGFSARRFNSDVQDAAAKGFLSSTPHFNSVNRYLANPDLTRIIVNLIELSALPLTAVETKFALDSSGFSTSRFERWYDAKWGKERSQREWLKAHIACGVRTNIVTAVEITTSNVHDSPVMPYLLDRTAERFTMAEVSADKAYLSRDNLERVAAHGGQPFIPFKANSTGDGPALWRRLHAYFTLNEAEWSRRYHLRSNVETTFSMVKGKFGGSVRSKSEMGQVNEILLKFLCHNLCVVNQEMHELGVTPVFEPKVPSDSKVINLNQYRGV